MSKRTPKIIVEEIKAKLNDENTNGDEIMSLFNEAYANLSSYDDVKARELDTLSSMAYRVMGKKHKDLLDNEQKKMLRTLRDNGGNQDNLGVVSNEVVIGEGEEAKGDELEFGDDAKVGSGFLDFDVSDEVEAENPQVVSGSGEFELDEKKEEEPVIGLDYDDLKCVPRHYAEYQQRQNTDMYFHGEHSMHGHCPDRKIDTRIGSGVIHTSNHTVNKVINAANAVGRICHEVGMLIK